MRWNPSPFMRDVLQTTATSGLAVACLMVTTWLVATRLGPDGFGAYSIARRFLTVVEPVSTLAAGLALTRYLAITDDERARASYLRAGTLLALVPAMVIAILGISFSEGIADLLFGDHRRYQALWRATLFLVVGNSLFVLLYSYYRGTGRMRLANLWQGGVIGVGPLAVVAIVVRWNSAAIVVFAMAGLTYLAAGPLLRIGLTRGQGWRWLDLRAKLLTLGRYSLPRIPGNVAFGGILAAGPLLAPYIGSLREAGYLVVGQSLLRLIESGTDAFGRVAFPRFTQVFSEGGQARLRDSVQKVICFAFDAGCFITVQLVVVTPWLTTQWLGRDFTAGVDTVRITLLSLVPYLLFVMLRPVLDATEPRAVVTGFLLTALVVTLATTLGLSGIGFGPSSLAAGTTLGFAVLGVLILRQVLEDFAIRFLEVFSIKNTAVCLMLVLPWMLFMPQLVGAEGGESVSTPFVMTLESAVCAGYLSFLWWRRSSWLHDLSARLQGQPPSGWVGP